VPWGIVDAARGALPITCGSSDKPSDGLVATIAAKWDALHEQEQAETRLLQITRDHGPERRGRRTPLLARMVPLAAGINKPMQRRSSPPYHRTDNPIERGWGLLALQWNGAQLIDVETMLGWAKTMPWQGRHPVVARSRQVYEKGLALSKAAMQAVEARLKRAPQLPKDDMVIHPASTA
jgi:Rhodopirellula transposase DDE domain